MNWLSEFRSYLVGRCYGFLLRLCGKDLVRTGSCRCCGSCCRQINLRYRGSWLRSLSELQRLQNDDPRYRRFELSGTDPQGILLFNCTCQLPDGRCGDYEHRLDICTSFPSTSLLLCGGSVPDSCGFSITAAVPFAKHLKAAQRCHGRPEDPAA